MITSALSTLLPPLHPAVATYLATSTHDTYAAGSLQSTTIARTLALRTAPTAQGLVLTLEAGPPVVRTAADPEPLVTLAQQLAGLYARLELLLTPAGEVAALLNHSELCQQGERLLTELQAAAAPDDQVTATVLAFARRQLAAPAAVLHSLSFDYLYQALLPGQYRAGAERPARQFAGFFDKTPLWFTEEAVAGPATAEGLLPLRLQGALDAQRTNLRAVQARQAEIWQRVAQASPPAPLPAPHFCYEATYAVEQATGLPQHADLTVYARAGQLLNQEYHLTLKRI